MPAHDIAPIDLKVLVRGLRAHGIAASMEANHLAGSGHQERGEELGAAAQALTEMASELEGWRRSQAEVLRRVALSITKQRLALADFELREGPAMRPREKVYFYRAANITNGSALVLEALAQQLDARDQKGGDHD
nr:hypothetical protein [Halomonas socia]